LVPFGAALGGAAAGAILGALLNWRFNRRLERDRRIEAEASRGRSLLFEGVCRLNDNLVRVFMALTRLSGRMKAAELTLQNRDHLVSWGISVDKNLVSLPGTPPELVASAKCIAVSVAQVQLAQELAGYIDAAETAYELAASSLITELRDARATHGGAKCSAD
jgi:hypothetical protein